MNAVTHSVVVVNSLAFHDALAHSVEMALDSDLDGHNLAFRCVVDGRKCVVEMAHLTVVDGHTSATVGHLYAVDGRKYATVGQHEAAHHLYVANGQVLFFLPMGRFRNDDSLAALFCHR